MKHLKSYNEGLFDFFRSKSEDDKIALDFMKRLERIKGISPYSIEKDTSGTEEGEQYTTKYTIDFEDTPIRISKHEADKKYRLGWNEETQKGWINDGGIKKDNHVFFGILVKEVGEYIVARPDIAEDFFNLTEKIYNRDIQLKRIKKIKDEMNPAADKLDTDIYPVEESINIREVKFTNKRNPRLEIIVTKTPDGRIVNIENETGMRFPFSVGQILNRTAEVWACNNNFLMDDKDTCPEKKIFGVRASDVPQGHEWRHIFPNKFK